MNRIINWKVTDIFSKYMHLFLLIWVAMFGVSVEYLVVTAW